MRAERLLTALTLVIAVTVVTASANATLSQPAAAQATDDEAPTPPPVAFLDLGHRFSGPGWQLEIQDAFVVESDLRTDWSEVRVAVAFSTSDPATPFLSTGFAGERGYPELVVTDASGHDRVLILTDPATNLVAGSTLLTLVADVPARWTLGYEVPTAFTSELTLEARQGGAALASWNLLSSPDEPAAWPVPAALARTEFGEPIPWSEDLEITATEQIVVACGNPDVELVTVGYGMVVEVTNTGTDDVAFPDVLYPEAAGVAVWADGASARYSNQQHVFRSEEEFDPIRHESVERAMIPPETTHERVMIFIAPRDGRFVNVDRTPAGVILYPTGEPAVWVETASEPANADILLDCGAAEGATPFEIDRDGPITVTTGPSTTTTTTTTAATTTTTTTTTVP